MGDKLSNAKFDKDMNSMKQKLHEPFKNIQVPGKRLIDFKNSLVNLLFSLKVVL